MSNIVQIDRQARDGATKIEAQRLEAEAAIEKATAEWRRLAEMQRDSSG